MLDIQDFGGYGENDTANTSAALYPCWFCPWICAPRDEEPAAE